MPASVLLGIDQGTTSTRVGLMDFPKNGAERLLGHAQLPHRQFHPHPHWVEHDPDEIWEKVQAGIREVMAGSGKNLRPAGVAIANQGETILIWNRRTGRPLHPALVWQDSRTQAQIDGLAQDPSVRQTVHAKTGLQLDTYFSASKLRWLLEHAPGARDLAQKGELCAGTVDSWLIWKLTGGKSFVTDASTAARTLLFNIHDLRFDSWLLELFGIPAGILPEVKQSADDFGLVAGLGAKLDGTPIVASLVDQPAALFGQGCLSSGQSKATYGTGCFVYLNTGEKPISSQNGLLSTLAWQEDGQPTYALDGGVFAAGSALNWCRDQIGLFAADEEIDGLLQDFQGAGQVVCVPAFAGLGAPYWERSVRAAWLGIGLHDGKVDLIHAALEGIACQVVGVIHAMERDAGLKIPTLNADGGLTRCRSLMQIQADLLGVPVEVCENPEATLIGACRLGARRLGLCEKKAKPVREGAVTRYEPSVSEAQRQERLGRFTEAARILSGWSAR